MARLAPKRLQPVLVNSGCATVRRGASGSCPGTFRGAFGASKANLGALRATVSVARSTSKRVVRVRSVFGSPRCWYCIVTTAQSYFFPGSAHVASGQEIRRPWRGVRVGLKQMPWKQDFGGHVMENSTTGALGGEARWGPNMSEKWWETVARLAPERLQPGLGEFRVRKGAPGCIWELSRTVSGSFRSSEIGSRGAFGAPKSVLRAL